MKIRIMLMGLMVLMLSSCKKDGTQAPPFPTDGLVSRFLFEDDLTDEQGNTPDGTNTGGSAFVAGRSGKAISFNGTTQYVMFPRKTFKSGNNVSVSFWFRKTFAAGQRNMINCSDFNAFTAGSAVGMIINIPASDYAFDDFTSGTWTHFAGVYDGSDIKAYINGVLADFESHPGNISDGNMNLHLGFHPLFNEYWEGEIDDLFIYSKALSEAEVQQLANL